MRHVGLLVLALPIVGAVGYGVLGPPRWLDPDPPMCPEFGEQPLAGVTSCLAVASHSLLDGHIVGGSCPFDRLITSGPRWYWNGDTVSDYVVCVPRPS